MTCSWLSFSSHFPAHTNALITSLLIKYWLAQLPDSSVLVYSLDPFVSMFYYLAFLCPPHCFMCSFFPCTLELLSSSVFLFLFFSFSVEVSWLLIKYSVDLKEFSIENNDSKSN